MDALDKKIIQVMQEDFPLVAEPYKVLAERIGISQQELLERLKLYKRAGQIRKMGAVLRHREVGFSANALCAWVVAEPRLQEVAALMVANPSISHCYDREVAPGWPYNLYTMIHACSWQECDAIAEQIALKCELSERAMLYSVREWKKTSMRYFRE